MRIDARHFATLRAARLFDSSADFSSSSCSKAVMRFRRTAPFSDSARSIRPFDVNSSRKASMSVSFALSFSSIAANASADDVLCSSNIFCKAESASLLACRVATIAASESFSSCFSCVMTAVDLSTCAL